jgi:hypothetical protein
LTRFNSYLRRNDPFVSISDCRGLGIASNNPGHALLFSNAAIRGAPTAVFWINNPAAPIKPFASIADAAPWVRERLFDAGVEVSPAMEDLLANRM